jgi:hypothetical protein
MEQKEQYYGVRQPQKGKERMEHLLRGRYLHTELTNKETTLPLSQGCDL